MTAFIFAFIAFIGYGVGDIFGTIATRKLGGFSTTFWSLIIGIFLFSLYIPFALNEARFLTISLFFQTLIISIFYVIALVAFYQALEISSSSLVGAIAASFAAVVVVFSLIFLGEKISSTQALCIIIIFLGVTLSSIELRELKKGDVILSKGIILALIAMLSWGIYFTFIKIPVSKIGWFWPTYITYLTSPILFIYMRIHKIKLKVSMLRVSLKPVIFSIILTGIAEFSYNIAISNGKAALVAPVAGSYPVLFTILSFLIFKDPVTKQQVTGIVVTLLGVVLLAFNS